MAMVLLGLLTVAIPTVAAEPVSAQTTPTSAPEPLPANGDGGLGHSIQLPNSGRAPVDAGDRGGALQLTLVSLIGLGLLVVGGLAWRDIARSRGRSRKVPPNVRDQRTG